MPTRTVQLNIIGDSSRARGAIDGVTSKAETAGKRMGNAFRGVLGTLNSTGALGPFGAALDKIGATMDSLAGKGKGLGKSLMVAGGAGIGIGGLLQAAAGPEVQAKAQLKAAIEATGKSYEDFASDAEHAIKVQEKFGHTGADTQQALAKLTAGLQDPAKALSVLGDTANLAAAQHIGLADAATMMVRVMGGHGNRVLAQFGITHKDVAKSARDAASALKASQSADEGLVKAQQRLIDLEAIQHGKHKLTIGDQIALRNAHQAVTAAQAKATQAHKDLTAAQDAAHKASTGLTDAQELAKRTHGQAAASVSGFTGHLKVWKTQVEDSAAALGQKYGPALMGASAGITLLGGLVEGGAGLLGKFKTAQEASTAATEGMTVAEDAAAVSEGVALAPILAITAGIAALAVGAFFLVKHWKAVWGAIKDVVVGAWHFIDNNVVHPIMRFIGPIWHAELGAFRAVWGAVWGGVKAVIGAAWSFIKGAVITPLKWEFHLIGAVLHGLGKAWSAVWGGIKSVVSAVWDFLKPIFDAIGKGIGSIVGAVGKVGSFIGSVGGKVGGWLGFDQGGVVPGYLGQPTLAIVHGGETILPTHRGGGHASSFGHVTVEIPVMLDGRQIARSTARFTRDELIRMGRGLPNVGLA